jgi:hypothetical protein
MSIYFQAIILSLQHDDRNIDFCFTHIGFFLEKREYFISFLREHNIQEVIFFFQSECYSLPIQEKGKKIQLIHLPRISSQDFECLFNLSHAPVGCRGDQSFSLALTINKPFFYDPPTHAYAFLYDLVALAEHRIPEYPSLASFFKVFLQVLGPIEEKELAQKMAALLKDPELSLGFAQIYTIIRKEHCFNRTLTNLIARALIHHRSPEIAEKEELLMQRFLAEELTLKQLVHALKI